MHYLNCLYLPIQPTQLSCCGVSRLVLELRRCELEFRPRQLVLCLLLLTWMSSFALTLSVVYMYVDIRQICVCRLYTCKHFCYSTVVIWCNVLGSVLPGENPLRRSGPLCSYQVPGERRETGETSQFSVLPGNVKIHERSSLHMFTRTSLTTTNDYVSRGFIHANHAV